jgi:flagellar M-ring protein FliF
MDTALTPVAPMPLPMVQAADAPTGFGARLAALPMGRKLTLAGGIAGLVAIAIAMSLWSSEGNYKVLYANLADKDGGAILAQLSQMNVPYKHAEGGSAILVPADKVHDVRLKLASAGLPRGGTVGFELMDNAKFGQTQFQERLTFQRGLEGELTRSIEGLAAVQSARVHLALPNQNGFFREQQKPSASVLLTLHPGRALDRAQIAGIIHLVSSSVPELNPKAVSVLDQTGALVSGSADATGQGGLDAQQLQYVAQVEGSFTKRVLDLLEPVVGRDNLRAQVTADVDFSQSESTSEAYAPNQGRDAQATVRSQQTVEASNSSNTQPGGVPGATTNQPPTPATAPINGPAQALQTANAGAAGSGSNKREATTNYEVDKTVRVTRNATGTVKRLNAAVVVNHRSVTDAKGKTTSVPLTPEELEKLTTLVKESVGFNAERGDSVKVVNAPFQVEKIVVEDVPMWKQPEVQDLLRTLAVPGALALLAMIVVFGAVRPAIKAAQSPKPAPRLDTVVDDAAELPGLNAAELLPALEAPGPDKRLEQARQLAKDNPAALANLVRGWVAKEA